jgi:hypothetical protein
MQKNSQKDNDTIDRDRILDLAVKASGVGAAPAEIIARAEAFLAFMRGDEPTESD